MAGQQLSWDSFPRPSVAVDTAVLTVRDEVLCVVLTEAHGDRRLPGAFLRPGERLEDAVDRSLVEKTGIGRLRPQQLHVFDDPHRDDRGWVLSVAHLDVVPLPRIESDRAHLVPVGDAYGLPFDHDRIVDLAVGRLREEYEPVADPRDLLSGMFTLRDLQRLHEAVAGEPLKREAFRKRMERQVAPTDEHLRGVVGKPPRLYEKKRARP